MARLNIEDSIFKDKRFYKLAEKTGGVPTALGELVLAWMLAQKWHSTPERMIPFSVWEAQEISMAIIEVGLAERIDGKVRMKGADEQFEWLLKRREAGRAGGIKSGKSRLNIIEEKTKQTEAKASKRSKGKPLTLNAKSSPSAFSENDPFSSLRSGIPSLPISSDLNPIQPSPSARAGTPLKANAFIATYCEEWKARYGTNPVIRGKEAGISGRLAKDLGTEKASELVISYLQMNDVWFVQKRHDLVTFENSLNAVVQFHETGKTITRTAIFQNDKREANRDVWQQLIDEQRKKEAGNGQ